ncbi:MAG: flavodoxin domain-containing protein [Pseudomonadota bacterium]
MHIALIYASIEGQTRKIAKHIAALLDENHHSSLVIDANDVTNSLELSDVDGVIVCAPVHVSSFPKSVVRLLQREHLQLMAVPGAFVSVSMAVASDDESSAAEIDKIVHELCDDTGWWPVVTHNAAGALKYLEYEFFKKWMMQRISKKSGGPTDASQDYEFTNWEKLDDFVLQLVKDVPVLKSKI